MKIELSLKKISVLLFVTVLFFGCKNKENSNPASPEEIQTTLSGSDFQQDTIVQSFYKKRGFSAVWNDKIRRTSFIKELKDADNEGLFFKDYHGKKLEGLLKNAKDLSENERGELEVLLTDAFFDYSHDLYYGKVNPNKLYEIWGLHRKEMDFSKILENAIENDDISETLAQLKPDSEIYNGLKESLAEYREKTKTEKPFQKIAPGDAIEPEKSDPRIPEIAELLKLLGILDQNYSSNDSIYNEKLQIAVETFQKHKTLATDKIIGNSTIEQLNMGAQQRTDQLLVNLERWRWYPRDFGSHYIMVNIPNYELDVVKDGEVVSVHNIIAGDKTHHTPIFSDSIQYIVINPQWHIPSSIASREIIPSAKRNRNYLSSRNIFVTNSEGNRVDPSKINWDKASGYSFTQGAGRSNSLGQIKIIYPNKYAIYLHDTPAKALFEQNSRAESHGCVRVQDVVELAAYLLNNQKEWSLDKIQKTIASGQTKKVKVTQSVKVYHLYWTAWRENGKTIFTNDIYNLDNEVYKALIN